MANWIFDSVDNAITNHTGEVIFYGNDLNPDSIKSVVDMYNEGMTWEKIKDVLSEDSRLTPDEVQYITEDLGYTMENMGTEKESDAAEAFINYTPPVQDDESEVEKVQEIEEEIKGEVEPEPVEEVVPVKQTESIETPAPVQPQIEEKAKPNKKERTMSTTPKPTKRGSKVLSPQEFIQQMQEKIELAKIVSAVTQPVVPDTLSTAGKIMMSKLLKEHDELIAKYLEQIQDM